MRIRRRYYRTTALVYYDRVNRIFNDFTIKEYQNDCYYLRI